MSDSNFSDRLAARIRATGSAVCVGLDPRPAQLPDALRPGPDASPRELAEAFRVFCREVIDTVAPLVPVVKPQAAFFEQLGPDGMAVLAETIAHAAASGLIVVLDGKRNDIGSTAQAYAAAYLGRGERSVWGSDALTVSPYLGADSLQPFLDRCATHDAGIFVLVKTSNPRGGWLQDRESGGSTIYEQVANLVEQESSRLVGQCGYGPVGAVVGATYPEQLAELRRRMPSAWILVPGFGAQGGGAEDARGGFDADGLGAIVNSSRHIIFAHSRPEFAQRFGAAGWQRAVEAATIEMNDQLNQVR